MPTYRNDSNGIILIGGLNLKKGQTLENNYPFKDDTIVVHDTTVTDFATAISDGIITKTSDDPTYLLADFTADDTSVDTFSDWFWIKQNSQIDISISGTFTGTVKLERKYKESGNPKLVNSFNNEIETYYDVATSAYYRIGIYSTDFDSGSVDIKMG